MSGAREMKIVIKAPDEFTKALENAASAYGGLMSGKAYEGAMEYAAALDAQRAGNMRKAGAERELERLKENSPYESASRGPERIYLDYGERLERLRQYNAAVIQEMIRAGSEQADIERAHMELSNSYARARRDFQIEAAADTAGAISNTLQNLYVATGSKHRAIFETMKAFAIAETVIDTYKGATAAYAALAGIPVVGPALGAAAAAAAIAAGLARVEQIRNTHPGGGSISSRGTANPSYSGGSPNAYPIPERLEERKQTQSITIQIYNPLSAQNWSEIVEKDIIPAINDATENRNISLTLKNMG